MEFGSAEPQRMVWKMKGEGTLKATNLVMQQETEQQAGYVVCMGLMRVSSDGKAYAVLQSCFNRKETIFFNMF